jgi:hypothetical protein
MKQLFLALFLAAVVSPAMAQQDPKQKRNKKQERRDRINALIKQEEEGVIAYRKHYAFGIKLTTDGYGISFEKGYSKSVKKATIFQIEITERKHQKETKQSNLLSSSSPVIYGKINYFYPIRLGVQQQFLIGNKSNKNGVSITGNVGGGIAIGLLRPYEVLVNKGGEDTWIRYESPDSLLFVSGPYSSGPDLGRGWSHLKVTPGLYLKPAVRFDYGKYNELVSAVEAGLLGEFYSKKIPQMVYNKQKQFFFSAYVSIMFGKRKNK